MIRYIADNYHTYESMPYTDFILMLSFITMQKFLISRRVEHVTSHTTMMMPLHFIDTVAY